MAALRTARDLAQRLGVSQVVAETGFWLYRAGVPGPAAPGDGDPDDPFTLRTAGRPGAAAAAWRRLGHPYEEAHALADVDDPDLLAAALDVADGLGAAPLAARLRARMRAVGVSRVPRGPQPATRANPAGLTARQLDVLELLREGLTDAEIAQRLVLSVKTVNHHVAAVLGKLGVSNRRAAARAAARLR